MRPTSQDRTPGSRGQGFAGPTGFLSAPLSQHLCHPSPVRGLETQTAPRVGSGLRVLTSARLRPLKRQGWGGRVSGVKEKLLLPGAGRGQKTAAQALPGAVLRGAAKASIPMGSRSCPSGGRAGLGMTGVQEPDSGTSERQADPPTWEAEATPLGHLQQPPWCLQPSLLKH